MTGLVVISLHRPKSNSILGVSRIVNGNNKIPAYAGMTLSDFGLF